MRVNWKNVHLIFLREVRDQLRDRRTLFMVAVLPLLLYPALGIGMVQLTVLFTEQARTVVLLGSEHLPQSPQLLDGDRFVSNWFDLPADADRLDVVYDAPPAAPVRPAGETATAPSDPPADNPRRAALLTEARRIRDALAERRAVELDVARLTAELGRLEGSDVAGQTLVTARETVREAQLRLHTARKKVGELFAASRMQVLIVVPPGFGRNLEALHKQLASRDARVDEAAEYPHPEVVFNKADDKSLITYNRVRDVLDAWESTILKSHLKAAQLPEELPHPVGAVATNLALDEQIAANLWGKLFPALLVIMSVTGAFYPAIDLVAGEKERGTMETLLICPATRTEIVLGKFLTVMSFSATTAVLNLLSMGLTGRHIMSMATTGVFADAGDVALPSLWALAWILVLLAPLSALFSALCLALATFARSSKEGQYYLTPLLMVTLGLTVFCLSPGVELKPQYSVVPVANIALLLKGLLLSPLSAGNLYVYIVPVLGTSLLYSGLALWWAIDQFNREEVLFREAERFDLSLWVRHLLRDKGPVPSFAEAGFCFVIIMLLQFAMLRVLNQAAGAGSGEAGLKVLMTQQLALVATPALIMGVMLTSNFRQTFRLYWPGWRVLAAGAALPFVLHPLVVELAEVMQAHFFEPLPDRIQSALERMIAPGSPLWLIFLAFAVIAPMCEEIAFRGFILSGFQERKRYWLGICLSALTFGLIHMIPQQVFNATLLGLVLGMLAVRGNSLLPCIVFHMVHNGLLMASAQFGAGFVDSLPDNPLLHTSDQHVHFGWPMLVICGAMAAVILRWLAMGFPGGHPPSGNPSGSSPAEHSKGTAEKPRLVPASRSVVG